MVLTLFLIISFKYLLLEEIIRVECNVTARFLISSYMMKIVDPGIDYRFLCAKAFGRLSETSCFENIRIFV